MSRSLYYGNKLAFAMHPHRMVETKDKAETNLNARDSESNVSSSFNFDIRLG